jgi:citrate lyase subunit beta/citryl-CoA lyase
MIQAIAQARSLLFVPGDRPERHAKALAAGADAVIIDLEDAVSPAAKAGAAEGLRAAWPALAATPGRPALLLRCNAAGTPWYEADLALAAAIRPDGLLLPKAESATQLADAARRLQGADDRQAVALLPLVESALGLAHVRALATSGLALRLVFGHLDFQADLGMQCADDEPELDAVRFDIVLASRLAGLPAPVDGVTVATGDAQRLAADVQRAQRLGYSGKLCIHPNQVAGVHQAFAPSPQRLAWAQRVMDALAAAAGGVVQVDGKMVDAPVIKLAQQVLAAARV